MTKSLDEIMSERVPETQDTTDQTAQTTETNRDEGGRFAARQPVETVTEEPLEPAAPDPEKGRVPLQALHAAREKERDAKAEADQLRQRLAQMEGQINLLAQQRQQPPKEPEPAKAPPDFWDNPSDFVSQALSPVQQQLQRQKEDFSMAMAVDRHGHDTVQSAYQALGQAMQAGDHIARADYQRIMQSPHPYGELVTWHQRKQAQAEIGDDPAAYRERVRAEILAEMQVAPPSPQPAAQQPVMPSSFTAARNQGGRVAPGFSGPKPLSEIMKR